MTAGGKAGSITLPANSTTYKGQTNSMEFLVSRGCESALCHWHRSPREGWHHFFDKQAQRAQRLLVGEAPPSEGADHVVAAANFQ